MHQLFSQEVETSRLSSAGSNVKQYLENRKIEERALWKAQMVLSQVSWLDDSESDVTGLGGDGNDAWP